MVNMEYNFLSISTPGVDSSGRAGLRRVSAVAGLLRLWVRIPPGTRMSLESVVCC
jgi:hypothetical protein